MDDELNDIVKSVADAAEVAVHCRNGRTRQWHVRFVSLFGLTLRLTAVVFSRLRVIIGSRVDRPKYLLWALNVLWCYDTESATACRFRVAENTLRLHAWRFISYLPHLRLVSVCFFDGWWRSLGGWGGARTMEHRGAPLRRKCARPEWVPPERRVDFICIIFCSPPCTAMRARQPPVRGCHRRRADGGPESDPSCAAVFALAFCSTFQTQ